MNDIKNLLSLIEEYIEEGNESDLESAMNILASANYPPADILRHLQAFKGDTDRKAKSIMTIRRYYNLALVPGPVCKTP